MGWMTTLATAEIIRVAVEEDGAQNLTNKALPNAIHKIDNFDTGGITPPLSWKGEDTRLGCREASVYHFDATGRVKSVTWHPVPHEYEMYGYTP